MVEQQDVLSLLRFWLHLPADEGPLAEVSIAPDKIAREPLMDQLACRSLLRNHSFACLKLRASCLRH